MKKIVTLMTSVALVAGLAGAAVAHPSNSPLANQGYQYRHGDHGGYHGGYYRGGYHNGWRHHGYRGGPNYSYDDGDDAWAGVLPGVVFGTILGSALSR